MDDKHRGHSRSDLKIDRENAMWEANIIKGGPNS